MPGKPWTTKEVERLQAEYKKKPFNTELEAWSYRYAKKCGRTGNAVANKVRELFDGGSLQKNVPRVLLFDIETLPLEVFSWDVYNQFISPENVIKDWSLSCWSAKWLMEPEIFGACAKSEEAVKRDDERILKPLWKLINKADVVIGYNSNKFDIKRINTRFLFYGMGDTMPFVSIDALAASRLKFDFTSFKLDYVNKYLGLNGKSDVSMEDHRACARGDKDALEKMYAYNQKDVFILEEYYMRIRSYVKHPNFAMWAHKVVELEEDEEQCPVCSGIVTQFNGTWVSPSGIGYEAFRCPHCGAIGRRTERKPGQAVTVKRV